MFTRAHVYIYGDVTGVGYRYWTVRQAKELGLTGWVRNVYEMVYPERRDVPDGTSRSRRVEAIFEGSKEKVEEMVKRCHKGPEVSWVEKVETKWEEETGEFEGFEVRY